MLLSVTLVGVRSNAFARCLLLSIVFLVAGRCNLAAQVTATIAETSTTPGIEIAIPLTVSNLTGKDVRSFEFVVSCDTAVASLTGVSQQKTLSEGLAMYANNKVAPFNRGRMKVVCASAKPLAGQGILVNLLVTVGKRAGSSPLAISDFMMNTGMPGVKTHSGSLVSRPADPTKAKMQRNRPNLQRTK